MPPCSARSSTSRDRGGLRPCLTGPNTVACRVAGWDGGMTQSSIEHRDGSCGKAFLVAASDTAPNEIWRRLDTRSLIATDYQLPDVKLAPG
jgi:hypothetical protein